MFSLLFIKYGKLILQALIVVAIIVAVFLLNPFNIFGTGLKLENTANMVSNVRTIGQLITAEYYGEVIATLDESQLNMIEEDNLEQTGEE